MGGDPRDRGGQRRSEDQAERSEEGTARDRHDQHREGVDGKGSSHGERLDELLQAASYDIYSSIDDPSCRLRMIEGLPHSGHMAMRTRPSVQKESLV